MRPYPRLANGAKPQREIQVPGKLGGYRHRQSQCHLLIKQLSYFPQQEVSLVVGLPENITVNIYIYIAFTKSYVLRQTMSLCIITMLRLYLKSKGYIDNECDSK